MKCKDIFTLSLFDAAPAAEAPSFVAAETCKRDEICPEWRVCSHAEDCFDDKKNPRCDCLQAIAEAKENGLYCHDCNSGYIAPTKIALITHYRSVHKLSLKDAIDKANKAKG